MELRAWASLSTANLIHNAKELSRVAYPAKIIGMLKANAYGHGIRSVGKKLAPYVDMIGVASIEEAMILRNLGINNQILLMQGVLSQNDLALAAINNLSIVLHSKYQLDWLNYLQSSNQKISVWIKIDTGFSRLGLMDHEFEDVYRVLQSMNCINKPIGIMSHLAYAQDKNHQMNFLQLMKFSNLTKGLNALLSVCNSAGLLNFPQHHFDYVRPGIALYGISPMPNSQGASHNLRPVMTVLSRVIAIKIIPAMSYVGYDCTYQCAHDTRIAIVSFGYGDGYSFTARTGTPVLIGDKLCKIVGRVSMDMMAVDIANHLDIKIGDQVVLWGNGLPIEEVAMHTLNIPWNMLTAVQNRVKFVWE